MMIGEMDGKQSSQLPTSVTVVQQADGDRISGDRKSRVSRKHVIIAVSCLVVAAMVITGILVGVKFFLDTTNDIVTQAYHFKTAKDGKSEEDVKISVKENFVQYHVKDNDTEVWVIDDFNRDVRVMKVKKFADGVICLASTLDRSDTALPQALLDDHDTNENVETEDSYYKMSETPISDKSMLGTHGQKLCGSDIDVHWLTPTTEETLIPSTGSRQKRAVEVTEPKPTGDCKKEYYYYKKLCKRCKWRKKYIWYVGRCSKICD